MTDCVIADTDGVSSEAPVAKEANSDSKTGDQYWTPKRLKEAQPIEMPHPASPPDSFASPPSQGPDRKGSVSGSGNAGGSGIAPDETNILFPGDETIENK